MNADERRYFTLRFEEMPGSLSNVREGLAKHLRSSAFIGVSIA